jgi:CBS domain-containing protein
MSWTVGSVMTRDVETVRPAASYKEIVERMQARRVSALPVVNASGRVVGVVSAADLLLKEERPPYRRQPVAGVRTDAAKATARNAAALMTTPALTIDERASLTEAARIMHARKVKRLVVVHGDGRVAGIVSRSDVLSAFARSDDSIAEEVRRNVLVELLDLDPSSVTVTVEQGVVRLEGLLETRSLTWLLVKLVEGVEGVVGVDAGLRWRLDDRHMIPDDPPLPVGRRRGARG